MKTQIFAVSFFLILVILSVDALAQRGMRSPEARSQQRFAERPMARAAQPKTGALEYCQMIPDLTEEQEEAINKLRLAQIERNTRHQTQMDELRARKRSIMRGVSDDGDVNEVIDEMTDLRNAHMKQNVEHRQAIRELLTEDQRIIFDSKAHRRPGGRAATGRQAERSPRMGRGRW